MKKNLNRIALSGLFVIAVLVACKKKSNDPAPVTPVNLSGTTISEFKGTYGGANADYAVTSGITNVNGINAGSSESISSTGDTSFGSYNAAVVSIKMKPYINLTTQTFKFTYYPSDSLFKSFFTRSSYKYKSDKQDGVVIDYYVGDDLWSTAAGTADQTGSTITFTNAEDYTYRSEQYVRAKATFTCNVYNSSGDKKVLTGTYLALFENN